MRKVSALSVLLVSSIALYGCGEKYRTEAKNQFFFNQQTSYEELQIEKEIFKASAITIIEEEKVPGKIEMENFEEDKRPEYKILNKLSPDILDYIYNQCKDHGISYELAMAIAIKESELKTDVVNKGGDYGLFQLRSVYHSWFAKLASIENFDPLDPKQNAKAAIANMTYLKEHYSNLGMSDGDVFKYMVVSYHRGVDGTKKYVKNIDKDSYLLKVREIKQEIEESLVTD